MLSPTEESPSGLPPSGNRPAAAGECSPARAVVHGALGFMLVSVIAFAVWAFGGAWFPGRGGEVAMYGVITLVFLALGGLCLHPLLHGTRRLPRFYGLFLPAFLAYAVLWSVCWFTLGGGAGEWLGAALGSLAFVGISALRFGTRRGLGLAFLVFFAAHTAGYFAGGRSMAHFLGAARREARGSPARDHLLLLAKLSWGAFYGLGFGAGLGFTYHALQKHRPAPPGAPPIPAPDPG